MRFPHSECCGFATMLGNCTFAQHSDTARCRAIDHAAGDGFDVNYRNSREIVATGWQKMHFQAVFGGFSDLARVDGRSFPPLVQNRASWQNKLTKKALCRHQTKTKGGLHDLHDP
jgi:hypothetical protein